MTTLRSLALLLVVALPVAAESSREAVREAASRLYVHGMTAEIATRDFGAESVPALMDLLHDPTFNRRDNVVAVLGFLGGREATTALIAYLEVPTRLLRTPVEDRAALLVPQALGRIAGRGEPSAVKAIVEMTDGSLLTRTAAHHPDPIGMKSDLLDQLERGLALAVHDRSLDGQVVPQLDGAGIAQPEDRGVFDSQHQDVKRSLIDYVNHVNVADKLTDAKVDALMRDASLKLGRADFDSDVACCAAMKRTGAGRNWGNSGDGLDSIDSNEDLNAVLNDPAARVKVVRVINWCGVSGSNFLGCAWIGGKGMAVVRVGDPWVEAALWAHEYGHNVGLNHSTSGGAYIMHGIITASSNAVSQTECNAYHTPTSGTSPMMEGLGTCTDADADQVQDRTDNCPTVANFSQADSDNDGIGDACEGLVTPTPTATPQPTATPTPQPTATPTPTKPPCVGKGGACSNPSQCCSKKCQGKRCR